MSKSTVLPFGLPDLPNLQWLKTFSAPARNDNQQRENSTQFEKEIESYPLDVSEAVASAREILAVASRTED
jgi:hypothetical protein